MRLHIVWAVASLPLLVSVAPAAEPLRKPAAVPIADQPCPTTAPRFAEREVRIFNGPAGDVSFDLHQAVVRHVDGCIVPAILRRDVDGRADDGRSGDEGGLPSTVPNFVMPL